MSAKSNRYRLNALVIISLLMALEIIFSRFLSIDLPFLRMSFGFLPISLIGVMFGPIWAAGANTICDILGFLVFPKGLTYHPGFTLSACLTGAVFGIILHKKDVTWQRVLPASLIVCLLINLGLNTLWISNLLGKGWLVLFPGRLVKELLVIPIQCILIPLVWKYIKRFIPQAQI